MEWSGGRSPETRRRFLLAGIVAGTLLVTVRAFQLGVVESERWRERALDQQGDTLMLPAPRGAIYDRDGVPLAASQEVYRVALAPGEVRDGKRAAALLRERLGLTSREAARVLAPGRRWVLLPGRYGPEVRESLEGVAGFHFERAQQRFYPHGDLAREVIGVVGPDGVARGGVELEFDSVLSGAAGRAVVRLDGRGRLLPGSMLRALEPVPGRDVYLTIDHDLQEIAEQALREAVSRSEAAGGELLLTDPATGEILASASLGRTGRARSWRAVTDPYEPGSTMKPFTVAALLSRDRASLSDSIHAEDGSYEIGGRRLTDVHGHGWITLAEALRESSNIAIAKAASRLDPEEQYGALRDFGFGSPTGVSYPSETSGRLRRPQQWTRMSSASLAIGYEVSVTPLQMAMAYGAIANGGVLLEPRLVREVRSRGGRADRSHAPRAVRRVIPEQVAAALREVLADAVAEGTGGAASLDMYDVAGKTGTTRKVVNGRYQAGAYISSFAGFFPAREPQLVFVIKLDEPRGSYYGGLVAAPVTRALLQAALATRSTPLDRSALAVRAAPSGNEAERETVPERGSARLASGPAGLDLVRAPAIVDLPRHAGEARSASAAAEHTAVNDARVVPDVLGLSMRDAVHRLHASGARVRVEGSGRVRATRPAAGGSIGAGTVVRVIAERDG